MRRIGLWSLWILSACGDGDGIVPVEDGGGRDAGSDAGPRIEAPDIPWRETGVPPVALAPCPAGWREIIEDGYSVCDPFPESGPSTCVTGQAHFPGEPGCRPVGAPCPAGEFAAGLPADGSVLYVRAGASPGGDGSLGAPFASLSEIGARGASTTIALARGRHEGSIALRAGERLVGACAEETILTSTEAVQGVITVETLGEPAIVRDLTIEGSTPPGVVIGDGRRVQLEGVVLDGTGSGILVYGAGAVVVVAGVVVRGAREEATALGRGVSVLSGARLEGSRLIVEQSHDTGLFVYDEGTEVVVSDVVVRDTLPASATGRTGRGIDVERGAFLSAERLLVERNREYGMFVNAAEVVLTAAVVRDTLERSSDGGAGGGVAIQQASRFEATRLLVERNREGGLLADHPDTRVILSDVVVRDTVGRRSDDALGHGIHLQSGARLEAARVISERNTISGVFLDGEGTPGVATDVLVRRTRPSASYGLGGGLNVQSGARLEVSRARFADVQSFGVLGIDGATLALTDVVIEGVRMGDCTGPGCTYGYGAAVVSATMLLSRFVVEGAVTCGVFLARVDAFHGETALDLVQGTVSGAQIGACVQVADYSLGRLTSGVEYRDNGTNLDTTSLPVPELIGAR